ncbi:hypothetical protein VAR608DRAFT_4309 [Variovorax sp. HW608]|uniref:hypothetical protein n=1 Tax=Variovorax sp. HW608 TaxID=1034889 RepID=UPI00081FEFF8|nr:hypothetical protein [Variovorax sp. HW608]SCK44402.1 hypothetical protein VAR608DRAFT_4309 [Variovorax sp. HW608]
MNVRFVFVACLSMAAAGGPWPAHAQTTSAAGISAESSEQLEADYRVIAARCGTPAFEKSFYKQSRAAVAAGLVTRHRDPAQVEKSVTALRRNPVVLIGAQSDCPAQIEHLKEVQKERAKALRRGGGGARA